MPLIIDGHNLLWAAAKLSNEFAGTTEAGLCKIIGRYLKQTASSGVIVFDGPGPRDKSEFEGISNLEVAFSGRASDCDSVIEHKIRTSTAPRHLTIVSSDRRLRRAAGARKATAMKSEEFWTLVRKELTRRRSDVEPAGKQHGISEGETEQWLKYFGLKQ